MILKANPLGIRVAIFRSGSRKKQLRNSNCIGGITATAKIAITPMKVAQVSKPGGDFEIVEREIPKPAQRQVRVKVQACGIPGQIVRTPFPLDNSMLRGQCVPLRDPTDRADIPTSRT